MVLKKRLSFLIFQWPKVDQVRNKYLNWWHNWQLKNRRRSHTLKGSHSMGDRRIFLKSRCDTFPLIKIYWMSLLSAGFISLDSTFKAGKRQWKGSKKAIKGRCILIPPLSSKDLGSVVNFFLGSCHLNFRQNHSTNDTVSKQSKKRHQNLRLSD